MHNVNLQRREIHVGSRTLTLETGKLAKQAHGAVIVRSGDTMVLVAASRAGSPRDVDFLPLTVDYREYAYASGRIPGGFFKREGKAAEKEILTSRLIDRPIRPLFPSGWRYETQIIALLMSADTENDADVLAITGASAALAISEIPFEKTVAGVRVGMVNNVRHQPDIFRAEAEHARPRRCRYQGRHRDGRGRREGSVRAAGRWCARSRTCRNQEDRCGH
jgi:polyribonucleotide nucleotidyltransferase